MKNEVREGLVNKIYTELYEASYPSADYDQLVERADEGGEDMVPAYRLHYLPHEKCKDIVEKHLQDIGDREASNIATSIYLGAAPSGSLEKVNENRKKQGLEPVNP